MLSGKSRPSERRSEDPRLPERLDAFRRAGPSVLGDFELGSDEEFRSGRPMLRGAGGGRAGSGAAQGAIATEVERSEKA